MKLYFTVFSFASDLKINIFPNGCSCKIANSVFFLQKLVLLSGEQRKSAPFGKNQETFGNHLLCLCFLKLKYSESHLRSWHKWYWWDWHCIGKLQMPAPIEFWLISFNCNNLLSPSWCYTSGVATLIRRHLTRGFFWLYTMTRSWVAKNSWTNSNSYLRKNLTAKQSSPVIISKLNPLQIKRPSHNNE